MTAIALLANPASGGSTEAEDMGRRLEAAGATVVCVGEPGDEIEVAVDRVAVAGGDGSIAPAAEAAAAAGVPLAVIPAGTANDFARAMALPDCLDAACRLAAAGTRLRRVDLCRMGERPFVNAANAGLAVAAAQWAASRKRGLGPAAYALGAVVAGARAHPVSCRVYCDGRPLFEGDAWQVIVAGTGSFGAGAEVEAADPADGALEVVVVEAGSRLGLLRMAYGLRTGGLERQGGVCHGRGTRVAVRGRAAFNVDGEIVPSADDAAFSIEPGRVELVVG